MNCDNLLFSERTICSKAVTLDLFCHCYDFFVEAVHLTGGGVAFTTESSEDLSTASGFAFDQLQCCSAAMLQAAGGLIGSNSNR